MLETTLNILKEGIANINEYGDKTYRKIAKTVSKKYGEDTPIPLTRILNKCGLDIALWLFWWVLPEQATERDRISRLIACDYAEMQLNRFKYFNDNCPIQWDSTLRSAIEVARRYANGDATDEELKTVNSDLILILDGILIYKVRDHIIRNAVRVVKVVTNDKMYSPELARSAASWAFYQTITVGEKRSIVQKQTNILKKYLTA